MMSLYVSKDLKVELKLSSHVITCVRIAGKVLMSHSFVLVQPLFGGFQKCLLVKALPLILSNVFYDSLLPLNSRKLWKFFSGRFRGLDIILLLLHDVPKRELWVIKPHLLKLCFEFLQLLISLFDFISGKDEVLGGVGVIDVLPAQLCVCDLKVVWGTLVRQTMNFIHAWYIQACVHVLVSVFVILRFVQSLIAPSILGLSCASIHIFSISAAS